MTSWLPSVKRHGELNALGGAVELVARFCRSLELRSARPENAGTQDIGATGLQVPAGATVLEENTEQWR
jgi:hypothetical protein